jgi:hypothetical protein
VTKERQAADAVAAGDFSKALGLYEELAQENPNRPEFARAAEILKKRVKK